MTAIMTWGIGIVLALQALGSPALDAIFLAITQLGGEEFILLIVPLVYWCIDKRFGLRLAVVFLVSALSNVWLKALFNTPRPYQIDARVRLIGPEEFNPGFPSGHAQAAATVWGALAWRAKRRWMWAVAIAAVALVALSRVYLGVHFPHDVIGGIVFGMIALIVFLRVEPMLSPRLAALPFGVQIALSLIVPPALLIVFVNRDSVAATATLSGLLAGYALQRRAVNFSTTGSAHQRGLRYVAGLIGTAAIYLGLSAAFGAIAKDEETALWFALRFVRYGLVGLWAGGLWPMLAVRIGLAARET